MRLERAYSLLTLKSIQDDARIIEGIATTPATDRMDDIVEPMGAQFALPIPFLRQHKSDQPVGHVIGAEASKDGIRVRVQFAHASEPPSLKERLDLAWAEVKSGLVRGLSIGFRPIESADIEGSWGKRFLKWEWLELSSVTIPANQDANIHVLRSLDAPYLTASGQADGSLTPSTPAGVPARVVQARKGAGLMKTISEQITAFEATRAAKAAERSEIMQKSAEAGTTLDPEQKDKYDTLSSDVREIDEHLTRLRELEEENKRAAKVVSDVKDSRTASDTRSHTPVIAVRENLPPGIGFARLALCKAAAFLSQGAVSAIEVAQTRYKDDPRIAMAVKAAVAAGTSLDSNYATELVYAQNLASEFIAYLRPKTIIGQFGTNGIPPLRNVPFNVRMVGQTTGGSGYWVGEGKPKPLTKFNFAETTLGFNKVAAIAVIAKELARFSVPSAEALVRDALAAAIVEKIDMTFIDPSVAAVSNVSPASITNGLSPQTSAGTSADNVRTDVGQMLKVFLDDNMNPSSAVFIMPNSLALALSLMVNSLGQPEFPGLTMNGGFLQGIPIIASQYAAQTGGGRGNLVILVNAQDILLGDDGNVTVDISTQASLEMLDASLSQDGTAGTGASLVSLWQNNLIGLLAEREITWKKRQTNAVVYMDDVNWGSIGSPA